MSPPSDFWCCRRLIVTVDGPEGQSVFPLDRPVARIGRESGSDIVLNNPWVARRSLYLHATDEGVFCFYFQPEETESPRLGFWLAPGEPVLVGPYRVSACLEGDEPGPAPALVPMDERESVQPPIPMLHVYAGDKLCAKRRLRARLNLIGRRHQCALQLNGQQVSSFHGCFYWQNPRLWYVDLVSSNGTLRGGHKIDCCEVHIGDRLEVGEFTVVFQRLSRGGAKARQERGGALAGPAAEETLRSDVGNVVPAEPDELVSVAIEPARPDQAEPAPAEATSTAVAAPAEDTALAVVSQTRQELALLQHRVQELTQVTAQIGKNAAQELALQTREAFQRERQWIAEELERRAGELAQAKLALEERWQGAARELATQVSQLRDEATLLSRQRQAMEQSRLLWDAQRGQVEQQLRTYAQHLARLQQSAPVAIASAADNEAATAMVLAAAGSSAALTPRSHVVDAHVADQQPGFFPRQAEPPGIGFSADGMSGSSPAADFLQTTAVLDGTLSPEQQLAQAEPVAPVADAAPRPVIKGRKASKGKKEVFDLVTNRLVELDQGRRRTMVLLGIAGGVAAVALATLMIVAAVLLR